MPVNLPSVVRVSVAVLSLSAAGFVYTTGQEGYTSEAIQPVKGDKWTYGFGTTGGVKQGDTITPPRAVARAYADINKMEAAGVKRCVTAPLTQYEYDAYVDFSYHVGTGMFCDSTMVKKVNALDYAGACAEFSRFTFYQGKDCKLPEYKKLCGGIVTRRASERAKCEGK